MASESTPADRHRVELTFDDGVGMRLIHPEGGCDPPSICSSCGRYTEDPDGREPCGECPSPDDECWLQGWADNLTADELLHGKVTLPIEAEWDHDGALFHLRDAARAEPSPEGEPSEEKLLATMVAAADRMECGRPEALNNDLRAQVMLDALKLVLDFPARSTERPPEGS